jgi:ABC-type branched-subunit amino acid transport system substrate-binding protein
MIWLRALLVSSGMGGQPVFIRTRRGSDTVVAVTGETQSWPSGVAAGRGKRPFAVRIRRHRSIGILLLAGLLVAACSSSGSSSPGSSSPGPSSSGGSAAAPLGPKAPGSDVGITSTQIRVAMIADVNTPVAPGLFQKSVNAVKAWATIVNQHGGLAGRQVVVDFCDGKLDPNATTNCVIQACAKDFAMVGTAANALTDLSDIDGCKNAAGQAVGIPNLAAFAFPPLQCDPDTFAIGAGDATYCATQKHHPQTYTVNVGDFRHYTSLQKDLHGIWVYDGDVPAVRITSLPAFQAGSNLGIKKDGQGFYTSSGQAPQSALTPMVVAMKQAGSTFGYGGATPANTVLLRREAQLQGLSTVKIWGCNQGCYDASFLQQGGSAVEGTYALLFNLPFYTEYQSNPALSALVKRLGGISNLNNNALSSYTEALLFQDAVQKAVANGGTLNRQTLMRALKDQHSFNAQGIIGPTDVASHMPSPCIVMAQVKNGTWQRAYPAKPGTFDCNSNNVVQIKMDLLK